MIQNDWFKLLRNIPSALTISFVRPLWNDPGSNLKFLAFLENISLLALLVISFFRQSNVNSKEKYILYSIFIFGLTIYLALGLTIPVTGALMRYKIIVSMCFLYFATWKIFKPKQP